VNHVQLPGAGLALNLAGLLGVGMPSRRAC
jgi:hypothetical protein